TQNGVGEIIWFGTRDGHVRALNDDNMSSVFDFQNGSGLPIAAIAHEEGTGTKVFAGTAGGNLVALDERTGSKLWTASSGNATPNCACGMGSIASSAGSVYMGAQDGFVYRFSATDGAKQAATASAVYAGFVTVSNGVVYGLDTTKVRTFDATSLALVGTPALTSTPTYFTEPVPADGALWLVEGDGFLHKLA
ncbi:MAG TPA: PQQ-binding-like beta-propeller repeat protein, partial [Acidimicrobiia bacterium]|nr:PQQ-binding-like beta-propeller repeat protein [Acidimicrobiia bacterium]